MNPVFASAEIVQHLWLSCVLHFMLCQLKLSAVQASRDAKEKSSLTIHQERTGCASLYVMLKGENLIFAYALADQGIGKMMSDMETNIVSFGKISRCQKTAGNYGLGLWYLNSHIDKHTIQ